MARQNRGMADYTLWPLDLPSLDWQWQLVPPAFANRQGVGVYWLHDLLAVVATVNWRVENG